VRRVAVGLWLVGAAIGCAALPRPPAALPEPAADAWTALAEGRRSDAARLLAARLAVAPTDPVALFGRATIAYNLGDALAALDDDVAALRRLGSTAGGALGEALAPVAAGRVRALWNEIGPADRRRLAALLRPADLARAPSLAWLARVELARLANEIAREATDAATLSAAAAGDGCVQGAFEIGAPGQLAHLDLPNVALAATGAPTSWRPISTSGCHLELPPAADLRRHVRLVRASFEAVAGEYDVVVDFGDEARLAIDGGAAIAHGSPRSYGPRVAVSRLRLAGGRHDLTLALAASAGQTPFGLLVFPAQSQLAVRFVDPRAAGTPAVGPAAPLATPGASSRPSSPGAQALLDYCAAYTADRVGAVDEVAAALERLSARPRFAVGLALAGAIAHDDPTRPAPFARDAARRLLQAALDVDPDLARAWQALAGIELDDDRPRDATTAARRAEMAAPGWWAPDLLLARVLAARGLDVDAGRALTAAAAKAPGAATPCVVLEALRRDAEDRRQLAQAEALTSALAACGGDVEAGFDRARARGHVEAAIALLRGALSLDPDRDDLAGDLALMLAGQGRRDEALAVLTALSARDPEDPLRRVRLADALAAAGRGDEARRVLAVALDSRPDVVEVRRAARALGVPLPLDGLRVDGRAAIRAFEAAHRQYAAPAVMVLDRDVTRVFPSGATMTLTHEIVRVDSKDAIDRWGEVQIPAGAEILTLRTHKPDGSTREPEEIAGKESISAADLAIGDYLEWELLESHAPSEAFAPGFLVERFFFQSFDAPMARSELMLVTPAGMRLAIDARAGAPRGETRTGAAGTTLTTFVATDVPQLYAERSAVPAIDYVPSVRASSGVGWGTWARYLSEELHDAVRVSPEVRALARTLAAETGGDRARTAAAIVDWVTQNIEASDELAEPAGFTLARGRGSRVTLTLALAAELGVPAQAVLARSRLLADAEATAPPQELDDFSDTLVVFDLGAGAGAPAQPTYVDLRLRHAAFGYVPPGLDGARTLSLRDGTFGVARSSADQDRRTIDMTIRLDEKGSGVAVATEELAGWPALEWAELVDRFGADRVRLREDFEQRWLGVQFPGARLRDLQVDLPRGTAGRLGIARVRYSFVSAHLAVPVDKPGAGAREMRIAPTFFRSEPGRRFAAEPQRSTALMLGFEVPTRMTATVELPAATELDARGIDRDLVVARAGGYRFVEERDVEPGRPNVIVLHRESALPIMRVAPDQYAGVAADLRRVDGAEQAEIRIKLSPVGHGGGAR
jgi:tetratricopeptide (TPR) repeat protein